jgi:hypothetical protein
MDIEIERIDFSSFKKIEINGIPESIIKSVSYLKLDGSFDDILFKDIDNLKIANSKIYILDARLRRLVVFDATGAGLGKVGSQGQGPGEYLRIHDFCVNDAGDICFLDGTGGNDRLFIFDKDLKFVSVRRVPFDVAFVQHLANDKFLFALSSWNKGDNASSKIAVTDDKFKTEKTYMQYDEYVDENMIMAAHTFTCFENKVLYNISLDNFVFEFSDEGEPLKAYYFDFGSKNVPNEDKKNIERNWEKFERYCYIRKIVLINDKYIAGILRDEGKFKAFIVDRNENCLYISNRNENGFYDMQWYSNNQLVSSIYPGYEDIQTADLPQDVKDHLASENFVLCLYELK